MFAVQSPTGWSYLQRRMEMTLKTLNLPFSNALLYISDALTFDPPRIDEMTGFWTTPHCVTVSCLPECDGDTELTVGTMDEIGERGSPRFDGRIKTPSRRIAVETVLREKILEMPVPHTDTRIRIWTNGYLDTDTVIVGLE